MKKYIMSLAALLVLLSSGLVSCKKDERDINMNLSEVTNLIAPADARYIKLNPAANLTETFEWDQARAEDGSLVLYEVVFDQENGDFSSPFYTVVSNSRGVENKLTLTHGQLNQIASLGGADFFQRKKFRWTVYASKGTNVKKATVSRIIDLERPGGFASLPGSVFILGSATEVGDNLSSALKMRQTGPGEFEIFTKLKAGTYRFVDGTTGSPRTFYLFDNGGIPTIGVNGNTSFTGPDKIMRIRLNFNDINGSYAEVKKMSFWYCNANTFWFDLDYVGNGLWQKNDWATTLQTVPWGLEERYKYRMVINDGTGDRDVWINSSFGDPPGQDGQYPSSVPYRTIYFDQPNGGSQWDWAWKLDKQYVTQGSVVDYWVSLRGSEGVYTQGYVK
ncbi:MAG TPA: SusE domain-containing protein [Flavisolibacter sp.]|nr:SusE domain-containing protein [Flavisolibacter sp.]